MKNKLIFTALILLTFFSVQNAAAGGEMETPVRSIIVRGSGTVSAAPDIVSLNLGVQSSDRNLNTAIEDNNSRIENIMEVIKDFSIPEADISTSNFSVYYQQPYGDDNAEGSYNVSNSIFVKVRDIEIIGKFIEEVLNAGANQFYGLEYGISNPEPLIKEARKLAIENAVALAEETAGYAGLGIGSIISIEEAPYYGGAVFSEGLAMDRKANSIITVPGEKTVEVQINLKIELK